ncbi:cysteine-rich and transmembrane domain-containing protein 1-like [Archocentrus centrarchus]|uniref:cysteine-rich and transmembrane domain-containing protein 1-like n=1 Tax=Archocentrus centrarchus TaxID=63155 RepID=UPI0011E9FFEF|nr:cysteine-rich and transmembrane domain-containing protein 1-like [Archocentrus centrarchus]XP_030602110.1 cysteine-rich and transmembrane domain-containing protein 1-like [Archocentrus centrarchus]
MSGDQPPPYHPHFPEGPSAPTFPSVLASQPGLFPGSPYQTFPQSCYHQHPGYGAPMPPQGSFGTQPAYQGGLDGSAGASYPPKHTVYVVDQHQDRDGGRKSCLAACSTLLCCCCLWDLLTRHLC